jgi:hypothetical protein
MDIPTERYLVQAERWPWSGRHILACHDDDTLVVYQAYRPEIALWAVRHQHFGEGFSYGRMSWIKPGFLWMMYRSDWARSPGQEIVLGIRVRRSFFDAVLGRAVASSAAGGGFATDEEWRAALRGSEVRLQWDPDHLPHGANASRRALQIGLRGLALEAYGKREIVRVVDMSDLVAAQRANAARERWADLVTPLETVYRPSSAAVARAIGLDDA